MSERSTLTPADLLTRRRLLQAALGLAALQAARCAADRPRAREPARRLRQLHPTDEAAVSPKWGTSAQHLVFLPLVRPNAVTGELEPCLARSWERSADWRTWTVRLRDDIRWHDGVPVTAHDIAFTFDLLQHTDVLWLPPGEVEVTVVDDFTFRARYGTRLTGSPMDDWTVFYPRHRLAELDPKDFYEWEFWTRPVGNGPYRYLRHVPKTMVEFEANPDHFSGPPRIERVTLKLTPTTGGAALAGGPMALAELMSGNVDIIHVRDRRLLLKLADDPRFRVYDRMGGFGNLAIAWNHRHPAFGDVRVRRALTLAIDRAALHHALNLPPGTPIFDVLATPRQFHRRELPEPLPFDSAEAAPLLDAAGWRDRDGDGVREKDGRPLRFTLIAQAMPDAATFVQAELRRIGVAMEIRRMEGSVVRNRVLAGDFDAVQRDIHWAGNAPELFGEEALLGYRNPEAVRLITRAGQTADPAEVDRIYAQLMRIFRADLPVTFLAPYSMTTVAHRRVRGLSAPYRTDPLAHMDEVWLEQS